MPPALEVQCLNHWTTREVPDWFCYLFFFLRNFMYQENKFAFQKLLDKFLAKPEHHCEKNVLIGFSAQHQEGVFQIHRID